MDRYHLLFTQEAESLLTVSVQESIEPQSRLSQAEFVKKALANKALPERLREKLSKQLPLETKEPEFRRYFAHLVDNTPVQEKREKSQEYREKLQQRLQQRKEGR